MNYYNILLLIILIVFCYKTIYENFNINNVDSKVNINQNDIINNKMLDYRLGDIINGYFIFKNEIEYLKNLKYKYYGSIGHELYEKTGGFYNKNILYKIIKERSLKLNTIHNVCLHLRIGDVINDGDNPDKMFYLKETNFKKKFNSNFQKYHKVAKLLKYIYNINEITIFAGAHKIKNLNESIKFINKVKLIFLENNFKVNLRLGNNPDEDFLLMCNADIFIMTGGNFSKRIANYIYDNNKILINPENI